MVYIFLLIISKWLVGYGILIEFEIQAEPHQKFLLEDTYSQKVNLDTNISSDLLDLRAAYNLVKFLQ